MLSSEEVRDVIGSTAYAEDGEKIGRIGQVFLDDETGRPEFITVNTGLFGMSESFVPVAGATATSEGLTVPFSKDKVKDAPNVEAEGGHLSQQEERVVYEYYGLPYSEAHSDTGLPAAEPGTDPGGLGTGVGTGVGTGMTGTTDLGAEGAVGHDTSGPNTDDAMTRSEEQLNVGTRDEEAGRVRLRKYVETEHVTQTVPVRKERAVLEREPITEGNVDQALDGPAISDEEHEVVLHEEKPVVEKTAQPVERVRLGKETDVDEHEVSEAVRKEQVEVEGDVEDRT